MAMRAAVVTVSDRAAQGARADRTGPRIVDMLQAAGFTVDALDVVPDSREQIAQRLAALCDNGVDLVVTNGGTGFSPRDVTPEATRDVIEREAPGLPEAMRFKGLESAPRAMLSRAVAGIRGRSLIVNLPGSPGGAADSLEFVLPQLTHAVAIARGESGGH